MLQTKTPGSSQEGQDLSASFDLNSILTSIKSFGSSITDLGKNFTDAFNSMENAVIRLSTSFGGGRGFADTITQTMAAAQIGVSELGGGLEDIANIQKGVIKTLQTQTILNEESFKDLYAASDLLSDGTKSTSETYAALTKNFVNAGYSIYDVSKQVQGIIMSAKEVGVVASAVYSQLNENMKSLTLFNFENGVQGMAKMAAQAAGLRINMKDTLRMADQLFDPEKAIDMAANFQRLGVQVTSLLDPYKLMDMARNDPKKLQESIIEATKSLTYFDEKNQKMSILPGAQGHLRELAKAMGMSNEELAQMAINSGELERKLKEIKFPSEFASEQDRTMIANMAQMKDGKYQVTFTDERGELVTKEVAKLEESDRKAIMKQNADQNKSVSDLQREANGYLREIANAITGRERAISTRMAASRVVQQGPEALAKQMLPTIEGLYEMIGIRRDERSGILQSKELQEGFNKLSDNVKNIITTAFQKGDLSEVPKQLSTIMKDNLGTLLDKLKELPQNIDKAGQRRFKTEYKSEENIVNELLKKMYNSVGVTTNVPTITTPTTPSVVPSRMGGVAPRVTSATLPTTFSAPTIPSTPKTPQTHIIKWDPTSSGNFNVNINTNPDTRKMADQIMNDSNVTKAINNAVKKYLTEEGALKGVGQ